MNWYVLTLSESWVNTGNNCLNNIAALYKTHSKVKFNISKIFIILFIISLVSNHPSAQQRRTVSQEESWICPGYSEQSKGSKKVLVVLGYMFTLH